MRWHTDDVAVQKLAASARMTASTTSSPFDPRAVCAALHGACYALGARRPAVGKAPRHGVSEPHPSSRRPRPALAKEIKIDKNIFNM